MWACWRGGKMGAKYKLVLLKPSQVSSPAFISLICREHIYSTYSVPGAGYTGGGHVPVPWRTPTTPSIPRGTLCQYRLK